LLDKIEGYRVTLHRRAWQWSTLILSFGAALAVYCVVLGQPEIAAVAALAPPAVILYLSQFYRRRVCAAFRAFVIPELVRAVDPALSYHGSRFIAREDSDRAGLWQSPDRYSGRDLVEGAIGDTHIRFSIVHAEEKYTTEHTDGSGRTSTRADYRTLFCGLFFSAECNHAFSARTTVQPRAAGILRRLSRRHVAIEDPRFTESFAVSSEDHVEARHLLTPALIERLMALRGRLGEFHLVFIGGRICLTVSRRFNLFDASIDSPPTHPSQIEEVFAALKSMTDIVTDLDLNTRRWTKQRVRPVAAIA
jgi:hypothetical protein